MNIMIIDLSYIFIGMTKTNREVTQQTKEVKESGQSKKEVKKLADGSIQFPYSKESSTGTIINFDLRIKKEGNNFVVENQTKITENNKGYIKNVNVIYPLDTSSTDAFLVSLGVALNGYVGEGRPSAVTKWREAYRLLWFGHAIEKSDAEQKVQEETKKATEELKNAQQYRRNSKNKELSYDYTFRKWSDKRTVSVSFQTQKDGSVKLRMVAYRNNALGGETIERKIAKDKIATIPTEIETILKNGISLSFRSWEIKIVEQETLNNIGTKAKNAVRAYNYYLSQEKK